MVSLSNIFQDQLRWAWEEPGRNTEDASILSSNLSSQSTFPLILQPGCVSVTSLRSGCWASVLLSHIPEQREEGVLLGHQVAPVSADYHATDCSKHHVCLFIHTPILLHTSILVHIHKLIMSFTNIKDV